MLKILEIAFCSFQFSGGTGLQILSFPNISSCPSEKLLKSLSLSVYNDWFSLPIPFFQPYSHPSVSLPSLPSLSSSSSSSTILLHLAILLPWSCSVELTFKQSSETSFHLRAALCLFNRDVLHFWDTILLIQGCLWYAASALQKASPLST